MKTGVLSESIYLDFPRLLDFILMKHYLADLFSLVQDETLTTSTLYYFIAHLLPSHSLLFLAYLDSGLEHLLYRNEAPRRLPSYYWVKASQATTGCFKAATYWWNSDLST